MGFFSFLFSPVASSWILGREMLCPFRAAWCVMVTEYVLLGGIIAYSGPIQPQDGLPFVFFSGLPTLNCTLELGIQGVRDERKSCEKKGKERERNSPSSFFHAFSPSLFCHCPTPHTGDNCATLGSYPPRGGSGCLWRCAGTHSSSVLPN